MSSHEEYNNNEWTVETLFNEKNSFAIILLNQPLSEDNKKFLKHYWNNAAVRIVVDGGANHLRNMFCDSMQVPEIVSGDFDSALPESLEFFKRKGSNIIHTPDQDETDFTKAVRLTLKYITEHNLKVSSIISIARCSGRLDHIFANLNTLYLAAQWSSVPIFILGDGNLTWLLMKGSHRVLVPYNMRDSTIGLIPLGVECTDITTTGLKWNLTHDKMKFGSLISTSNRFDDSANEVCLTTDAELIWTMEFKMSV